MIFLVLSGMLCVCDPMTIQAVARRANVSTATVSRTINSPDKVHPATAKAVLRAIRELNFHPNRNAQALGTGRSSLFGLIISDITNPFFPELVKSFEMIAVDHGQEVLVTNTNYDPERMNHCVSRMLQRKVDGVALMTSEIDEKLVASFARRGVPLVFLDLGAPMAGVSTICVNYKAGIDEATRHLVDLGHRNIGFISGPLRLASARSRYEAFLSSMAEHGLDARRDWVEEGNHRIDGGRDAMNRILARPVRPTAVLCSNDLTAIGAIGSAHLLGLGVPEDLSVVGFDDIELSAFLHPPLTTVHVPRVQIAQIAFRALFQPLPGDAVQARAGTISMIQPSLVVRGSTSAPTVRKAGRTVRRRAPGARAEAAAT